MVEEMTLEESMQINEISIEHDFKHPLYLKNLTNGKVWKITELNEGTLIYKENKNA